MPPIARLLAASLLALLAVPAAGPAHGAGAPGPRIAPLRPEIAATDNFVWLFQLRVRNPLDVGVYTDSLIGVLEDQGPGETRAGRTHRIVLTRVTSPVSSISARDSAVVVFESPAIIERGLVRLSLHTHAGDGRFFTDSATVKITPGTMWRHYRSELVPVGKSKVEVVLVSALGQKYATKPGVLLIHGHGADARRMIPSAWLIANEGYEVMLVSQPGYGQSDGPADMMGPATMRAVNAAFDRLRRTAGVDSHRVAVWGQSRGATAAMLLAARRREVRGVIAEGGVYDLWATYRDTKLAGFPETIAKEAGRDSAAWRARSPVMVADSVRAPVFLVHGEEDTRVPFAQAKEMGARLKAANRSAELRFIPGRGHAVSSPELTRKYFEFLERIQASP
jgi:pimeloyl-ACP methyl ester carboxylesterase